jgi:ELWxxDGT repeat protein
LPSGSLAGSRRQLFFAASEGTSGTELWLTDGTAQGTQRVKDIWEGLADSTPSGLVVAGKDVISPPVMIEFDPPPGTLFTPERARPW